MRATYFNSMSVVSVLLLTIVCTTFPALADVNITAAQVGEPCDGRVVISWDATSETTMYVRAFGLDVRLDNDANIVSVVGLSYDYWVYPGSIQIAADGTVTYIGSIGADYADLPSGTLQGPPDGNGVTLEAASLYAPPGFGSPNGPAQSGDLAEIIVDSNTCLTITANVARAGPTGVIMEDPNVIVNVNFPGPVCVNVPDVVCCLECMKLTCPDYATWEAWGKPKCWCYSRQCRGDADGIKTGPFWVAIPDLNLFRLGFNKMDIVLQNVPNGICCDCDHVKTGPFRCGIPDLECFRRWFNKPMVPECPMDCYNFWETP